MASTKISALTSIGSSIAAGDLFVIVDVSDTTMAASGTDKKATLTQVASGITLDMLSDVIITSPISGEILKYNGTNWVNGAGVTGSGTVNTVAMWTGTTALGDGPIKLNGSFIEPTVDGRNLGNSAGNRYGNLDLTGFIRNPSHLNFYTNGSNRAVIRDDGRVGITELTPAARLEIKGSSSDDILITKDSAGIFAAGVSSLGELTSRYGYHIGTSIGSYNRVLHINTSSGSPVTSNIFAGVGAGVAITSAINSSFFGKDAGGSTDSGGYNTFVGSGAGQANTSGDQSVALGFGALASHTSGTKNTALGVYAFNPLTSGDHNIGIGSNVANSVVTTCNNCLFIGDSSGSTTDSISSSIAFGREASVDASNQLVFGSQNYPIEDVFIGGNSKASSVAPIKMQPTPIQSGTTNTAGAAFTITGGVSTGNVDGGNLLFKTTPAGASGTTQNALVTILNLKGNGNLNMPNLPTSAAGLVSGDVWNNAGVLNII